jgi:hypothetical protein
MIMKALGAFAGVLILSSASMAQQPSAAVPQSPTGGPLKSTTGSNMPAPGLSGRHPNNVNPAAYNGDTAVSDKGNMAETPSASPVLSQGMNSKSDNLTAHNGKVTKATIHAQRALEGMKNAEARNHGTVNDYTAAQVSDARDASLEAGYIPDTVESAQAGNLFLTATKNGQVYTVVVTPNENVYASTPLSE